MYKKKILDIIKRNDPNFVFKNTSDKIISSIERKLQVILPDDYKWFLKTIGAGNFFGIKIFGYSKDKELSVLEHTNKLIKNKFFSGWVVIEETCDCIYYLDTCKIKNNRCPVAFFYKNEKIKGVKQQDFLSFLYSQLLINSIDKEKVYNFIQENKVDDFFSGGSNNRRIDYIEEQLNLKLSESYKWFLKTFGSGGIYSIYILGDDKNTPPEVITETQRIQKYYGLSKSCVVIQNYGEFVYCLDTSKMFNNECPVFFFDKNSSLILLENNNFLQYLFQTILEAKDDSEE